MWNLSSFELPPHTHTPIREKCHSCPVLASFLVFKKELSPSLLDHLLLINHGFCRAWSTKSTLGHWIKVYFQYNLSWLLMLTESWEKSSWDFPLHMQHVKSGLFIKGTPACGWVTDCKSPRRSLDVFKLLACPARFPTHLGPISGYSPAWSLWCLMKAELHLKAFPHSLHS